MSNLTEHSISAHSLPAGRQVGLRHASSASGGFAEAKRYFVSLNLIKNPVWLIDKINPLKYYALF